MTLLLLIPILWLAIAAFVVVLCRMAARSDAALVECAETSRGRVFLPGVLIWRDAPELAAHDMRGASRPSELTAGVHSAS